MGDHGGCGEGGWGLVEGLFCLLKFAIEICHMLTLRSQGTTIEYDGDKAGRSLASMGWTGKRGDALPPVWVVVHKVC